VLTIILDNRTTAMTGHQANPGSGQTLQGQPAGVLDFEAVCRGLGIRHVAVVDAYDNEALDKAFSALMRASLQPEQSQQERDEHHDIQKLLFPAPGLDEVGYQDRGNVGHQQVIDHSDDVADHRSALYSPARNASFLLYITMSVPRIMMITEGSAQHFRNFAYDPL